MSSELHQRKNAEPKSAGGGGSNNDVNEPFGNHAGDDAALQSATTESSTPTKGLTAFGRFSLFVVFPFSIGSFGLFTGYLRTRKDPDKKLDIDTDFIFPSLLALLMVVVVGFQTNNFQGKAKPLVLWPKVKRKKKIVHKTVIVDDDGEDKQHQD